MILAIECIIGRILFGITAVGFTGKNKTAWLNEYAPKVRERFLQQNPDYVIKSKKENIVRTVSFQCTEKFSGRIVWNTGCFNMWCFDYADSKIEIGQIEFSIV